MRTYLSIAVIILLLMGLANPSAGRAEETLNNSSIIELQGLKMGDALIIAKINGSKCDFDTSIDGLKQLKAANVSDAVIGAMLAPRGATPVPPAMPAPMVSGDPNDPLSQHPPGIYYFDDGGGKPTLTLLDPSAYAGERSGRGFWVGYGQSIKNRAQLNSAHASLQSTNRSPVFYFYFDPRFGANAYLATSPNEFTLAQFECDEKKGERTLVIGQFNAYSGSHIGPDAVSVRHFDSEKLQPGIYKITFKSGLANGEYGFFNGENRFSGRVFDFGVHSTGDDALSPTNAAAPITDPQVAALCATLTSDKPSEVIHALKELREKYAPEAIPKILPCLNSSNSNVIRDACRTLAVLGSKNIIPYLQPLLNHPREDVRKDAQAAIDKLQGN